MQSELSDFLKNLFRMDDAAFSYELSMETITAWDSLKHMELITELENKYQFQLSMEEIAEMTSFNAVKDTLAARNLL